MRIKRMDLIKDDPVKVTEVMEKGTLGNKLGLLRVMQLDNSMRESVGKSILDELLSRHRRIDHREHPIMVAYFSQLGFEVVHLKTGEGDMAGKTVSIERKEDDFMDSLFDDRRLRQLGAMREEAEYSYLFVTKTYAEIKEEVSTRGVSEQVLTGFIASLCAVGYPPVFIADKYDAAVVMRKVMDKIDDDHARLYVPRPKSPKPQEYRNAIVESLPKVGRKTRRLICTAFPSIHLLCGASVEDLMGIDGVGKKTAERIHEILHAE
tara:strand:+ start:24245 stop:25036 length:792 start_codon:yes stop_codon:yes gene_type:complete